MSTLEHDVVVIGGGIIGLACAYYLAADGFRLLLLESGLPGAEQTVRTGGGIRLCHSSVSNTQLAKLSYPLWERFEDTFGVDPQFKQTGHLFLARSENTVQLFHEQTSLHGQLDIESEFLDPDAINDRWQHLNLGGYVGGLFCEIGGYVNHYRVVVGLYQGALRAGADIHVGERVMGVLKSGQQVVGVETTEANYHAGHVVNCAGALAGRVAALADLDLPIVSRRHELLVVQPERPVPDSLPWLIDVDKQVHLRPDGQGRGLVGGFLGEDPVVNPDRYDPLYSEGWASRVRLAASESFDLLEPDATIVKGWAGIYAGTPDYHPVIEQSCPGLITAAGFSGTGLMHAPGVGILVSELARTGVAQSLDISELDSARFRNHTETRDGSGF